SLTDMMGRVQQIQSALSQLEGRPLAAAGTGSAAAPGAASTNTVSAAAFAQALSSAAGTAAPATGVPAAGSGSPTGADLVAAAEKYIGLPYVWGGTDPAVGLDCSGFVQRAFKDLGIEVPRVTWDQMKAGTEVASLAQARPGDLIFSRDGGHVSIYLGNGKAIDAPQPGRTIQVRDAWENDGNITAIRRLLPAETGTGTSAAAAAVMAAAPAAGPAGISGSGALTDLVAAAQASLVAGGAA
ncbi:C40 family peptidase, partial [Arthrobacter deserti]|nr:C40 family peptidase [Arthrobacter deserti]